MSKKKEKDNRPHSEMYAHLYLSQETGTQVPLVLEHYNMKLSKYLRMKVAEDFKRITKASK